MEVTYYIRYGIYLSSFQSISRIYATFHSIFVIEATAAAAAAAAAAASRSHLVATAYTSLRTCSCVDTATTQALCRIMFYIVMAYPVLAYIVNSLCSDGLFGHGPCSFGLYAQVLRRCKPPQSAVRSCKESCSGRCVSTNAQTSVCTNAQTSNN